MAVVTTALILAMKEAQIAALRAKVELLKGRADLMRAERWKWPSIDDVCARVERLDSIYQEAVLRFYAAREAAGRPEEMAP